MRIATFNMWNSPIDWDRRLAAIADELRALSADVVALQEAPVEAAPGRPLAAWLADETGYHALHLGYPEAETGADGDDDDDRTEGLALLSRHPIGAVWRSWDTGVATHNSFAAKALVEVRGATVGITNVHLDWEHADRRVPAIADILDRLVDPHPAELEILCGDFNEDDDGPVAAYLAAPLAAAAAGAAAAAAATVRPPPAPWHDAVAMSVGRSAAPVTLDFVHNPRWAGTDTAERPARFDRIYLRSAAGRALPRIAASGVFGREPVNRLGIVPSDHYGVFVDLAH